MKNGSGTYQRWIRWWHWSRDHFEHLVLGFALLLLITLLPWWATFFRRLTLENFLLHEKLLYFTIPAPELRAAKLQAIHGELSRRLLMLTGETATLLVGICICIVVLFIVARQKTRAKLQMERMLSLTTHELKTPIAATRALLQSLSLGSVPVHAQTRLIEQGIMQCDRLAHLADTILAYQRALMHSDQLMPHEAEKLVMQTLVFRGNEFGQKIIWRQSKEEIKVWADADAFFVVLGNLLDNAEKYGELQGIELETTATHTHWELRVRDHGIGFAQERAAHLFEPFFRESRAEVSNQRGSGLGLYIAKQLVEKMNGTLTAQSDGAGRGSVFTIRLKRVV